MYSKLYTGLAVTALRISPEESFLAASKEEVINDNTEVVIDEQIGGGDIVIGEWD